jgi:hypothetical protein
MEKFKQWGFGAALAAGVWGLSACSGGGTNDAVNGSGGANNTVLGAGGGLPGLAASGAQPVTSAGGAVGAAVSNGSSSGYSSPTSSAPTLECPGIATSAVDGAAGGSSTACAGISLEAEAVPVDLFIMMDRSVSMNELVPGTNQTRWAALRSAVEGFVAKAAGSTIRAGIGFFGRSGARDDAIDCDASAYANPSVEIGALSDVGSQLTAAIDATPPGGLTPTLPALQGALSHARLWAQSHPGRATSVVLVTDGFPTQCQSPVSISDIAAVASDARSAAPFVRTFVIGVAAGFNLDSIAQAGGTNHAYLVDESDVSASFEHTLSNISDSRISCEYQIPAAPNPNVALDPEQVQLVYSPVSGVPEQVPRIASSSACGRNPNGGWYYDNPSNPTRISVCPCTCARFNAGRVDVRLGCEPYIGLR